MNAILPAVSTHEQQITESVSAILRELSWSVAIMTDLVVDGESEYVDKNPEMELPRLIWLIHTPDVLNGAHSTSTGSDRHTVLGTITKDILLTALEAIVQSSDAFPPLKSAASGLLFFATAAEMASSNRKQIRDIYRRIDGLAASLKRGIKDGDLLSPAHQDAIAALAQDIAILNEDLRDIVSERKSALTRFFGAKRHRAELQDVIWQLDNARSNYTTAIATLNASTNTQVLAHVRALTLVMGVQPVPMLGTRRADVVSFPFNAPRIEEV
ncbi:hypothetical protein PENSPDRAFT_653223 [Peniophora sp. CONT]|nr:hypothetical protein PENSPDRAFT_653223 [Peniophora sp. CONT]